MWVLYACWKVGGTDIQLWVVYQRKSKEKWHREGQTGCVQEITPEVLKIMSGRGTGTGYEDEEPEDCWDVILPKVLLLTAHITVITSNLFFF